MNAVYDLLKLYPRTEHRWVGAEVERIFVRRDLASYQVLHYHDFVKGVLEALVSQKGWRVEYEVNGNLLALQKNLHSISVEPGGQFEVSAAPQKDVHQLKKVQDQLDREIFSLLEDKSLEFLTLGLNPWEAPDDIQLLPSPRYELMDRHFAKVSPRGREMMRLSTGLQINVDFETEEEGMQMLRVGFYLAPFLSALFSNSPFLSGKRTNRLSERHFIWKDTDRARSGFIAPALEPGYTLREYTEHVSKVPLMYAYDARGEVWDPQGKSLGELPESLHKRNALGALRQLFTEVRIKPCCVELRFFDQVSDDLRYAATAASIGILYSQARRREVISKFSHLKVKDLESLMTEGAVSGLRDDTLFEGCRFIVAEAKKGLKERGLQEESFLQPAEELISSRKTPAERDPFPFHELKRAAER